MSKPKPKFYVVWRGYNPGVYSTWPEASAQVNGYAGAQYKSFESESEARAAYSGSYWNFVTRGEAKPAVVKRSIEELLRLGVNPEAVAVDAACSGVPGPMEYRGVELASGVELFHMGPYVDGTNNVGEFLAIVHALEILSNRPSKPIYSDSRNALLWVKQKRCGTNLDRTGRNDEIFRLIDSALRWLHSRPLTNPLLKWETEEWGENPADFGRK
ncbi:MAG: ribonuclease H family protein [Acidobacteria bacterium]|nr:ribonuclease H family protein [Acidobacteriota bacterium]